MGLDKREDEMKTISGFTFIHNAIESGYPIVEAIKAVKKTPVKNKAMMLGILELEAMVLYKWK